MFDQYVNDEKAGQYDGWEVQIFQIFYFSKGLHKEKLEEREREREEDNLFRHSIMIWAIIVKL